MGFFVDEEAVEGFEDERSLHEPSVAVLGEVEFFRGLSVEDVDEDHCGNTCDYSYHGHHHVNLGAVVVDGGGEGDGSECQGG